MANILIVDDSKTVRARLKEEMKNLGFDTIDEAIDGYEAIIKYKDNKFDLVIMDINMPNVDGLQASKAILQYDEDAKIVVLTSQDVNNVKFDLIREKGVLDYLIKPIDFNRLKYVLKFINH